VARAGRLKNPFPLTNASYCDNCHPACKPSYRLVAFVALFALIRLQDPSSAGRNSYKSAG